MHAFGILRREVTHGRIVYRVDGAHVEPGDRLHEDLAALQAPPCRDDVVTPKGDGRGRL